MLIITTMSAATLVISNSYGNNLGCITGSNIFKSICNKN